MKIREAQKYSDTVVDILFEEKNRQGITSYKISKACGISESSLSYIKNHHRRPTLYTLKLIADAIGIDLSDCLKKAQVTFSKK